MTSRNFPTLLVYLNYLNQATNYELQEQKEKQDQQIHIHYLQSLSGMTKKKRNKPSAEFSLILASLIKTPAQTLSDN